MAFEVPLSPTTTARSSRTSTRQTMQLHHDKHHQAYVDKANAALEGTDWANESVEQVLSILDTLPEDKQTSSATTRAATRTTRCSGRS